MYIDLNRRKREDGRYFVTSTSIENFSAIVAGGENGVIEALALLKEYLERNVGNVHDLRVVGDASSVINICQDGAQVSAMLSLPPAHVIAEMTGAKRAGTGGRGSA